MSSVVLRKDRHRTYVLGRYGKVDSWRERQLQTLERALTELVGQFVMLEQQRLPASMYDISGPVRAHYYGAGDRPIIGLRCVIGQIRGHHLILPDRTKYDPERLPPDWTLFPPGFDEGARLPTDFFLWVQGGVNVPRVTTRIEEPLGFWIDPLPSPEDFARRVRGQTWKTDPPITIHLGDEAVTREFAEMAIHLRAPHLPQLRGQLSEAVSVIAAERANRAGERKHPAIAHWLRRLGLE